MKKGSFQAGFKNATLRYVKRNADLQRAVGIKLFSAIIMDSPVLTGRLRGNWNASLDTPNKSTVGGEDKSGAGSISRVVSMAMAGDQDNVFILNNSMPYAYRIEYEGWSKVKAPEGMVNRNVIRFKRILKEQLTILKK